ncbi:phospholipase D-like domain-containing protein [Ensifer sp. ZNC0028]|uniref:phospholipase D-like domain-containing protein n=1 Tax=Ensifer sp. ZNC0028 TaxID=1339236 RepID=UPI00068E8195|nr:phospholipase D-like domain-containing protein [Ensifer sp. ZNC0028]
MHFVSDAVGGYKVFAVSGVNTVSFAIDYRNADTTGLLGFAVERHDPAEGERYYMCGFKVFETVISHPNEDTVVLTYDHPVQSFVWDDFTAKPGRRYDYYFHPLTGHAKNIDRSAPAIRIGIKTEPLFSEETHDVFFNRGVASSQAYRRRFGNRPSDKLETPEKTLEALQWLSRDLDEALLRFIDEAEAGDTLLGCFYEFRYRPVVERLKAAFERGVDVRLVLDAKENAYTDKKGKFHESFPREESKQIVRTVGLPKAAIARWRENNPADIQHNKFMVLLPKDQGRKPQVWTGSTNLSMGGVHGQTNVGHWVRDADLAKAFESYWTLLAGDPGAAKTDNAAASRAKRKAFRKAVSDLAEVPQAPADIPGGVTSIFSPRAGSAVLDMYVKALDEARSYGGVTLAFGINDRFKQAFLDNSAQSGVHPVLFLLLEKRDQPKAKAKKPFIPLTARQNVYQAWGSYLRDPVYQWARETNARALGLNTHVAYVHSKFLLADPLGADPMVVTGSANFSDASTNDNDENMLLIRGDRRAADIYFTEFNRLFNHYYFRSVREATAKKKSDRDRAARVGTSEGAGASLFLDETGEWLKKYEPGKLRAKRVQVFIDMAQPENLPPI